MNSPKPLQVSLEGVVERITFESPTSSFRIVKLAVDGRPDRLAIVGSFPPTAVGARVRVRGVLETDRKHGEQLRVESLIEIAPDTLAGLERYLASGLIKGVGPKLAQRIVAAFGLDTLRVLEEDPDRLREVEGLGDKRRQALARAWREQRSLRDVMVFLQAHGASPALAARIVRRYGAEAMNIVSREPFRLALDVRGVGFKTADRIAAAIGVQPDSPQRMQAGALQVVHDLTDAGHTWTSPAEVVARAAALLGLENGLDDDVALRARLEEALASSVKTHRLVIEPAPESADGRAVFAADMYGAEVRLARRLQELAHANPRPLPGVDAAIADFETRSRVELAPEQRSAVEEAARRQVMVVTGGPGVGKTTIVRAILATLVRAGLVVRLAAPTGRAAKRLAETTGAEATTLHRLLDFDPKSATFKRDRQRPIEGGAVIVDEASMLDLPMADSLAQAIAPGTRLLLVGDVDQLPSVGPGAVLRDVIDSGAVPCVRLRQIFRQAARSLIVTNAHRINEGELPVAAGEGGGGDPADADFFVVERRDPEKARATVIELVTSRIPNRFGLDPVRDIQVLTPMNRGPAGAVALNQALQEALNPGAGAAALVRGLRTFRVGDKVMQLRNDYDKSVYNGDVGIVAGIDPEEVTMTVRFEGRDVAFEAAELDDLVLAYACTVHKSQGSEYPAVVIPFLTAHFVMLSKNLLYTAVTRGKRLVVLVCDPRALKLALSTGPHARAEREFGPSVTGSHARADREFGPTVTGSHARAEREFGPTVTASSAARDDRDPVRRTRLALRLAHPTVDAVPRTR
ncbi:MAG TPA: ATP-dependent RecD-like DNA helicase [Polyangiaceae bacterium]|nr:ATP-dependent RecD-like DNA helicase [Polyangiaceae bacterium]